MTMASSSSSIFAKFVGYPTNSISIPGGAIMYAADTPQQVQRSKSSVKLSCCQSRACVRKINSPKAAAMLQQCS
jgi:hypothetical protein